MKLLFLYVRKFGSLEDVQFNFDGNWRFFYDYDNRRELQVKYYKRIPDRFFSKGDVVESASALIGENGSGKTSVARLLCNAWKSNPADFRRSGYLAIAMIRGKIRQFGYRAAKWSKEDLGRLPAEVRACVEIKPESKEPLFSRERPVVYYSPFYTTERELRSERNEMFYNISTSELLFREVQPIDPFSRHLIGNTTGDNLEGAFRSAERRRVLIFLSAAWGWGGRDKKKRHPFPMVLPQKVELSIGKKWRDEIRADFMHPIMPVEDLGTDGDEGLLRSVNHAATTYGAFGRTLVHSVIWCVRRLGGDERKAWEIVDCFVKTELAWLSRSSVDYDAMRQALVDALEDLPRGKDDAMHIRAAEVNFLCDFFDCWKRKRIATGFPAAVVVKLTDGLPDAASRMMRNYHALVVQGMPDFLVVKFDPIMSSGEMAFLSLFGRLYECGSKMVPNSEPTIILDEVETTLHPAWQRKLVVLLVWFFESAFPEMRFQLLFASHSPMLLSDIPSGNVTIMKECVPYSSQMETFGASVFDLYRKAFDLCDGVFGALAKRHLDDLLDKIDENVSLDGDAKMVVRLFGNDLIRRYFEEG